MTFKKVFEYPKDLSICTILETKIGNLKYLLIHFKITVTNLLRVNINNTFLFEITVFAPNSLKEWHCFIFSQISLIFDFTETTGFSYLLLS